MNLPDFSKLRSGLSYILSSILLCLYCLGQPAHGENPGRDLMQQWAAINPGRIADWASQLPVGEAKREGIIGSAFV